MKPWCRSCLGFLGHCVINYRDSLTSINSLSKWKLRKLLFFTFYMKTFQLEKLWNSHVFLKLQNYFSLCCKQSVDTRFIQLYFFFCIWLLSYFRFIFSETYGDVGLTVYEFLNTHSVTSHHHLMINSSTRRSQPSCTR